MPSLVLSVLVAAAVLVPVADPFGAAEPAAAATVPRVATPSAGVVAPTVVTPVATAKKKNKKKKYRVKGGVTFNAATSGLQKRRAIMRKITKTINHAPKGSEVRIFSWKIWTASGVTALLNAQKRGVKVRAIMFEGNTIVEDNPHFWRLQKGLKAGNKKRKKARHSAARLCKGSCRGPGGTAHSKFFTFSKAGRSKHVYMHTSSNWGDAAAARQWNDMYTTVGNKAVYKTAAKVFDQAWKDTHVKPTWVEQPTANGKIVFAWGPSNARSIKNDRLMKALRQTKCRGATGGAGNANGRTIIRVAPDVMRGGPGMKVAKQLKRLWDNGCDVKIGYTVMGIDVRRHLLGAGGRGPVPMSHLVQDNDGDGVFDRYFHMKAYTINGRIGKNKQAYFLVQGSANTSGLALHSDETYGYFFNRKRITKRYQNHIDYWYVNFPRSVPTTLQAARMVATGQVDPYARMKADDAY